MNSMTSHRGYKWRSTFRQINRNNWTTITNVRGALINEFCETVEDAMCAKKNKKKTLVLFLVRIVFVLLLVLCCANTARRVKVNLNKNKHGWMRTMNVLRVWVLHTHNNNNNNTNIANKNHIYVQSNARPSPPRTVHTAHHTPLPPLTRQPHLRKAKQKQIDVNRRR